MSEKLFVLIIHLFLIENTQLYCQGFSLSGDWEVKKIEICSLGNYPGADIQRKQMSTITKTIHFYKNGQGEIKPIGPLLCFISRFYWAQTGDTLIMSEDSLAPEFYMKIIMENPDAISHSSKISIVDPNHINIERIKGCSVYCGSTWYNVVLEKNNQSTPDKPSAAHGGFRP